MSQRDEFVQIVKRMPKEEAKFFFAFCVCSFTIQSSRRNLTA